MHRPSSTLTVLMLGMGLVLADDYAVINKTGAVASLSAGGDHNCVLNYTGVEGLGYGVCWGKNDHGQASVPPTAGLLKWISAGWHHSCGINASGYGLCWGRKAYYVNRTSIESPLRFMDQRGNSWLQWMEVGQIKEISAGYDHTCALRLDGESLCWGWGDDRVGVDGFRQARVPRDASGNRLKFIHISAGTYHTCAVDLQNKAHCWGRDDYAQTTIPDSVMVGNMARPVGDLLTISAGLYHTCGIRMDGRGVCWGRNHVGQVNFPEEGINKPYDLEEFVSISTGSLHNCGLRRNSTIVCWGWNRYGQCNAPTGNNFAIVAVGTHHSCAATQSGAVTCWGRKSYNQGQVPVVIGDIVVKVAQKPVWIFHDHYQAVPPVPDRDPYWFS